MIACILSLIASVSAIEPNETKAMLDYYQQHTGKPAYALIAENWGRDTTGIWIIPEYRAMLGDLNLDGVVNEKDLALLNAVMHEPAGWYVCDNCKDHWYFDCPAIDGRTDRKLRIIKNPCLRCMARRLKELENIIMGDNNNITIVLSSNVQGLLSKMKQNREDSRLVVMADFSNKESESVIQVCKAGSGDVLLAIKDASDMDNIENIVKNRYTGIKIVDTNPRQDSAELFREQILKEPLFNPGERCFRCKKNRILTGSRQKRF